jgi:uncharacterized protein
MGETSPTVYHVILENIMNKYMEQLKQIILEELAGEDIRVFLFGSRARGTHRSGSDVDIGLMPTKTMDPIGIAVLRERIEASNIPYKVDIVNFQDVSDEFRKSALRGAVIWKN